MTTGSQTSALLFLGEDGENKTAILNSEYQPAGMIPTFGFLAADAKGNLLVISVVDGYLTPTLQIFAPPYTKSPTELNFGNYDTAGIAINAETGLFAVTEIFAGGGPGPSYVQFYTERLSPCNRVRFSGAPSISGTAFDRSGTLFLGLWLPNGHAIGSITGGCGARSLVINSLPSPRITPLGPLSFNRNDELVIQDQRTYNVLTFAHPKDGKFGAPVATTKLQGYFPQLACMAGDGKHL